jgi:ribosome-associated toxin RatA of RatAB toxin-antitoxin module
MQELSFTFKAPVLPDLLCKTITDFENIPSYLPNQLQKIEIIENKKNVIITEETIFFKTLFKKTFKQKTMHKISHNNIESEIISGPAKNTKIIFTFVSDGTGTILNIKTQIKLELKYKILQPLIKKYYPMVLTGILYKIINSISD